MNTVVTLAPGRGTKMSRNGDDLLFVKFSVEVGSIKNALGHCFMILGKLLSSPDHLGIASGNNTMKVPIPPHTEHMVINTGTVPVTLTFNQDISSHTVLYDPYLYEKELPETVNPDEFKKNYDIPDGHVDTLAKWYSVKYTFPDFNYIFVRPGLGISIQSHKKREEHWEVIAGAPIIIAGHKISYDTPNDTKFTIPFLTLHTVINPSKDSWVLIKESYKGEFDEEDIVRVYNPNNYGV